MKVLVSALLVCTSLLAAMPSCPAGVPLGTIELKVERSGQKPAIPLGRINQIEEGDQVLYAPVLRPNEKRRGEVAIVLVAAVPQSGAEHNFAILDTKDADKPARWKVPFRSTLAIYVYGPSGLSTRKLKGFLANEQELLTQLADYAEKTAQTEAVLQAIASYERSGNSENLGAALQGFAGQYGISSKIDRNASLNDQTLAALRTLNPALAAYDPISPSGAQRVSQTTGLAATVAGMFLGSTVGLAAGGTAMALNLKTLLFPDADVRSAYAQASAAEAVALCTSRNPYQSRKRLSYLWAIRIPDSAPPDIGVELPNHLPAGLKSVINVRTPKQQWKHAARVREWSLENESSLISVQVTQVANQNRLEITLPDNIEPGKYRLKGLWDWESFYVNGDLFVDELGSLQAASLTPESQNRLQQHSGKQIVNLMGPDFQFVEKAAIVKKGDKYGSPVPVAFSLPRGPRTGTQRTLEMQIDTANFSAGDYSLLLQQADGKAHSVDVKVVLPPPKIVNLPLTIHEGEREQLAVLEGEGLDRITGLSADNLRLELGPSDTGRRIVRVHQLQRSKRNKALDLRVLIKDYAEPVVVPGAVRVYGARPRILEAKASLPAGLQIALRPGELPAGLRAGIMLRVRGAGSEPAMRIGCAKAAGQDVRVQAGGEQGGIKLNSMDAGSLFLSLDPGIWPSGCLITAVLQNGDSGDSEPFELGRVVRLPRIEGFQLTEESAGDSTYYGVLTGSDLELIGKTGWDLTSGIAVEELPAPHGGKQSLRIRVAWPSPTPRSPLVIWFRGEEEGRTTTVRY